MNLHDDNSRPQGLGACMWGPAREGAHAKAAARGLDGPALDGSCVTAAARGLASPALDGADAQMKVDAVGSTQAAA
eukprot:16353618-Heterocapsa_arctica.AAC.1